MISFSRSLRLSAFLAVISVATIQIVYCQPIEQVYQKKCGRCHTAYDPSDYSADEWPGQVRAMKSHASLTSGDYEALVTYLTEESESSAASPGFTGPQIGGYLYTEYFRTADKSENFDIHYLAIAVSGWLGKQVQYVGEFELEHGGLDDNTFVEQAYLDYWFLPKAAVKIGAILTPFNRFDDFHEPLTNYLVSRPQAARELGVSAWKDVGIDVHGYMNIGEHSLGFDAYVINGLGSGANLRGSRQYRDNNRKLSVGGRVNFIYRDFLELGGSMYRGAWDDAGNLDLTMTGAFCLLHLPLLDMYGEFTDAASENPAPAENGSMTGYFIQASKLFAGRYRFSVRFGALDYLDKGDMFGRDAAKGDKQQQELTFGIGFYPIPRVVFKAEYTLFTEGDRVPEKDNDVLGLQAAVTF